MTSRKHVVYLPMHNYSRLLRAVTSQVLSSLKAATAQALENLSQGSTARTVKGFGSVTLILNEISCNAACARSLITSPGTAKKVRFSFFFPPPIKCFYNTAVIPAEPSLQKARSQLFQQPTCISPDPLQYAQVCLGLVSPEKGTTLQM